MSLSRFAVNRPVATIMIFLALTLLGVTSFSRLSVDLLPDLAYPVLAVRTECPDTAPLEIENRITRPIEEAVSSVPGIREIVSHSSDGVSVVTVEFAWGADMDFAALHLREKLDQQAYHLPENADRPTIVNLDPSAEPVIVLAVSSPSLYETKRFAENIIKRRLEQIDGIALAEITGGIEREIQIIVDEKKTAALNIQIADIAQALDNANFSFPGGTIRKGRFRYSLRTLGEFTSLDDIRQVVVASRTDGALIRLQQIAEVRDSHVERTGLVRLNGKEAVGVLLIKEAGANTVAVSGLVNTVLDQLSKEYPELTITPVYNQADFITLALSNVKQAILFGCILAIAVLFVFLRNIRSPLVIGISIPVSVIIGFILFDIFNVQLNIMSLGGLALGVGLLVDNSIIVLENIFRLREAGMDRQTASRQGPAEVAVPLLASTLTTIAVFLPIAYIQGVAGRLFRDLAFAVACSLLASLPTALSLLPVLADRILARSAATPPAQNIGLLNRIFQFYETILHKALQKPLRTCIYTAGIFLLTALAFFGLKRELMPKTAVNSVIMDLQLPRGAALDWTAKATAHLDELLAGEPRVQHTFAQIGLARYGAESTSEEIGIESARLRIQFQPKTDVDAVFNKIQQQLNLPPGSKLTMQPEENLIGRLFQLKRGDIEVTVSGPDLHKMTAILAEVYKRTQQTAGLKNPRDTQTAGMPEIQIFIDHDLAAQYHLSGTQIAQAIQQHVNGVITEPFNEFDRKTDIRIRPTMPKAESDLQHLLDIQLASDSSAVPLRHLITFESGTSPGRIERVNQARQLALYADVHARSIESVMQELRQKCADIDLPMGYELHIGGAGTEMQRAFRELLLALLLSIILVYMILAAQFESLRHPFLIILSVPMALIGVIWALLLFGSSLNILSFIGIVVLVGIAVNDAIIKISFINQRRRDGLDLHPAIIDAGKMRFRPILMTSVTTIFGMLPLALSQGPGAMIGKPLAIAIIGGLVTSTLLTLIVIPVFYWMMESRKAQRV